MGFDDLWEKYGNRTGGEQGENTTTPRVTDETFQTEKHFQNTEQHEHNPQNYKTGENSSDFSFAQTEGMSAGDGKNRGMAGVFGGDSINTNTPGSHHIRRNSSRTPIDWGRIRTWPWLDIVFIFFTVGMIINVIVNFEQITNTLFSILLPILNNAVVILLFVGVIVFMMWRLTRRRRRPRW